MTTSQGATRARGMTANEKRVVGYASTAHALNHVIDLAYAGLLVYISKDFPDLSLVFLGTVATASSLAYGISAAVAGVLADKVGSKKMLWIHLLVTGLFAALVAVSRSPWVMAATLTVLGLAAGMYHPVGLSFITRSVRERSMAVGYHGMAGSLGTAIAPALVVFIARLWSWQGAYVVLGVVAVLAAVAVFVSRAKEGMSVEGTPTVQATRQAERGRLLLWPLIAIFAVNMLGGFIYRGALTYLPLHLKENLGLHILGITPEDLAGYVATIALVLGIGGQYIGGWLGERVQREAILAPIALCILPFLALIGVANGVALVAAAGAFAFFNFMAQPAYTALIADYSPSRAQGSAFGVAFLSAFGVGSFAGTFGGVVAERWSTEWVFISLAAFESLIAALAAWLYVAARRRARAAG